MAALLNDYSDEIRSSIKEALYLSKEDDLQITLFKLRNICEDFFQFLRPSATTTGAIFAKCQSNLEKESLILWNLVAIDSEKYSKNCIAAVTYVVSRILRQITNSICDLPVDKKMILMKIMTRTCRSLLDCDQVERAEVILQDSSLIFDSLSDSGGSVAKFKFFNEMCRTEICVRRGKDEEAFLHVEKTKCLLRFLGEDFRIYLINFCYNLGLEFYYEKAFEKSTVWLRNAYQIGSECENGISSEFKCSLVLNLLADVYTHWNQTQYWEKALSAIQLSEKYGVSNKFLKLKIILIANQPQHDVLTTFQEFIQSKPTDSDSFTIISFLTTCEQFPIVLTVLTELETKLTRESDAGKFILHFLASLTTEIHLEHAQRILDEIRNENRIKFSGEMASRICDFCLDKGQEFHKKLNYSHCVVWYNLSEYISSYVIDDPSYALRTLQCKCLCYIHLQDVEKAVAEMEKINSRENDQETHKPLNLFLKLQVAILSENKPSALDAINQLDCAADPLKLERLLCLAIKRTLKAENSEKHEFVVNLLEKIVQTTQNDALFVSATKMSLRMRLQDEGSDERFYAPIFALLDAAFERLRNSPNVDGPSGYFSKIAWNLALLPSGSMENVFSAFLTSYKFLTLSTLNNEASFVCKLMTLLLACAAGLRMDEKTNPCLQVANLIEECQVLLTEFTSKNAVQKMRVDSMRKSILLYKFETCVRSNDSSTSKVLDEILSIQTMDLSTLEKLAAITTEFGENTRNLKIRILQMYTSKLENTEPLDLPQISAYYRSLISEYLKKATNDEQRVQTYESAEKAAGFVLRLENYPELEALWLMVSLWNMGVSYLLENRLPLASKWCILARKLLDKLPTVGSNYREKIERVVESQRWN